MGQSRAGLGLWQVFGATFPMLMSLLICGSPVAQAAQPPLDAILKPFQEDIARGMREWQVPGAAVAIVKDGRVVYLHGFGVRKLDEPAAVDAQTLFAIGSATKAFTAASVGVLVDAGSVHWDDPVERYLPTFRLADPARSAEITLRDLLSHRTGVAADNLLFWGTGLTPQQLLARFPALPIPYGLRSRFEYNNLMYTAVGEVVRAVSGRPWPEFVRERLFVPLGMQSTFASSEQIPPDSPLATAHQRIAGRVTAIPLLDLDNVAPAGAIISNVTDMARWVQFQLGHSPAGKQSPLRYETLAVTHAPQIVLDSVPPYSLLLKGNVLGAYGMGWMLSDYQGHLLIQHGGDTDGMASLVALVPDQDFGLVILTNLGDPWFRQVLLYKLLDRVLARSSGNWDELYRSIAKEYDARETPPAIARSGSGPPHLPICDYGGRYEHPLYGTALVSCADGSLKLALLGNEADLEQFQFESFAVRWRHFNALQSQLIRFVTFEIDPAGHAAALVIPEVGSFSRLPESH